MLSKRFYGAVLMGAVVLPFAVQGCSDDGSNPLCCDEFKVGATIEANIGGSAQSLVAVQAVADFGGIASAAVDDLTTACRSIATDLDAPQADRDAAEQKTGTDRMNAYCDLAVKAIGTVKAQVGGQLTIKADPPKCQASVSAKANCQAQCSGSAKCEAKADYECKGGTLEIACNGSCSAEGKASIKCEGKCEADCQGSCTAQGGVKCEGKCQGTCKGSAQGGTGEGIQADGTCKGTCEGTCEVTAPGVKCEGSCNGQCTGTCKAEANVAVKCDGKCDVKAEPLKCDGELKGGCEVDAKCDANCDASLQAKAECTPPAVVVTFSGNFNAQAAGKLEATLKANLGVILAFKSRLEGMGKIAGTFKANVGAVTDIKAACIPPVIAALGTAVDKVAAAGSASAKIAGSVGGS